MMLPNRQVKKVIFVGVLNKKRKKSEIQYRLAEEDLNKKYKLQVRSMRLKEECQNVILFPDSVNMKQKQFNIAQYKPIHAQSSLKYRKDDPFYIDEKALRVEENKMTVIEKRKDRNSEEERIEPEHHLFGIYLI